MKSSMLWSLADEGTRSAEGVAKRCQPEIVDVGVSVVGMINYEVLSVSEPCQWRYDVGGRSCREMLIRDRQR